MSTAIDVARIYSQYLRAYDRILPITSCYQELIKNTKKALRGKVKILDAGVGTGLVTIALDRSGRTIEAVDINPLMLNEAKKKVQEAKAQERISLSQQDIATLPFSDNYFDGVVCLNVLYHTQNYISPLRELVRVAGRDAVIVLSGPNTGFHSESFLECILQEFAGKENACQYQADLDIVVQATKELAGKGMKSFVDAGKMAEVVQKVGFQQIITARNDLYFGHSYLVVARK